MQFAPAPQNPAAFEEFISDTMRASPTPGMSHALLSGIDVYGLCRYAAGVGTAQERAETERQLIDHPWAHSRVVALVMGGRVPDSPAAYVLGAARTADFEEQLEALTDEVSADPEADLAELIDAIG